MTSSLELGDPRGPHDAADVAVTESPWGGGGFDVTAMDGGNVSSAVGSNGNQTIIPMGSLVSLNYSLPSMILVASILFVVIVATAFGNFLVALALFRYKYLRTISNYLIGNLAISDFLLATTILPLSTVNECLGHWVFGQAMCNFWLLTDVLYCTASIWNLCIIAFDRYTATLYPLWYREKRSTKLAAIYVAIVWIISAAICMPPLLGWNELSQNYQYDNTTNVYRCMLFETKSYVAYSASGSFYIPFFITFFLYIRIFTVLHKRMKKMRTASKQHQAKLQQHQQQRQQQEQQQQQQQQLNSVSSHNAKSLQNNAVNKVDKELAINAINTEGSGNTEELSSKSLFGSESGDEDDDIDADSSTQTKSDHAFLPSNGPSAKTATSRRSNGTVDVHRRAQAAIGGGDHTDHGSDTEGPDSRLQVVDVSCVTSLSIEPSTKSTEISSSEALLAKNGVRNDKKSAGAGHKGGEGGGTGLMGALRKNNLFGKKQKKKKIPSSQKRKYEQREMRATIRMAIIIAFFCGMWLGFFTIYFIRSFCSHCKIPRELDAFFFWLGYSNSSVNPILYTIFNEEFRKAFQKILGCYRKGNQHGRR